MSALTTSVGLYALLGLPFNLASRLLSTTRKWCISRGMEMFNSYLICSLPSLKCVFLAIRFCHVVYPEDLTAFRAHRHGLAIVFQVPGVVPHDPRHGGVDAHKVSMPTFGLIWMCRVGLPTLPRFADCTPQRRVEDVL